MYSGAEKYLIIAKESTFGTAGTTKAYGRVKSYGLRGKREVKRLDEHLGQPDHVGHAWGKLEVAGSIGGNCYGIGAYPLTANGAVPLEALWDLAFLRTSGQLASFTAEWSGGDDPLQHLGCKFNTFKFGGSADGAEITWEGGIVARDEIELASATAVPDPDPYGTTSLTRRAGPMCYQQGAALFEVDDVAKQFSEFSVNLDNKLASAWLGRPSAAFPKHHILETNKPTRRDCTVEIKTLVTDQFWADKVRADTAVKLEIVVQGYKDATNDRRGVFTIRGSVSTEYTYEEGLDALGMITVPILVEKIGTNGVIDVTWSDVAV